MHQESKQKYYAHLVRLIIALVAVVLIGLGARQLFMPEGMGDYGHYRGADIADQKEIPVRLGTNEACFQCHKPIRVIHKDGVHKSVSCEVCHGVYGDHIADGKKVGTLPVARGDAPEECLSWGVAAASAAVMTEATRLCDRETTERQRQNCVIHRL